MSGPTFFTNLKKNFQSYLLSGLLIILIATLTCVACFYIGKKSSKDLEEFNAMIVGIFSGALTSTPAFSAAKATADTKYESAVTGVIGVVLFVQFVPKILGANMDIERVLIDGGEYIKRTGTERTDFSSLHKTRTDLSREIHIKNEKNDKDKKDELNINNDVEKKIEYEPKRIPTERIESTTRQKKLIASSKNENNPHEKEQENEIVSNTQKGVCIHCHTCEKGISLLFHLFYLHFSDPSHQSCSFHLRGQFF